MHTVQKTDWSSFLQALVAAVLIFSSFVFGTHVYAESVTLSVNVQTALTFTTTNRGFATSATNLTPGTPLMATTSLTVTTNNTAGWNITLSGDNKNTSNNNLQKSGETTTQIADQTEWVNGAATTSAGTAVRIGSFTNSGDVLAFRVATATSTNGSAFYATTWWGSQDNYTADNANTLYAGIASSSVQRQIGNAGAGSYSANAHVNDVQYYLRVAASQPTGTYTAPITYTATAN